MRAQPPSDRHGWAGSYALALGVAALVCALLPVVSDVVAGPLGVIAVGLGLLGARWHQAGEAARVAPAIIGMLLGAVAVFVVVLMLAAAHDH